MLNKFVENIINYECFNLREGWKLELSDIIDFLIIYLIFILIVYLYRDCIWDFVVKIIKIILVFI